MKREVKAKLLSRTLTWILHFLSIIVLILSILSLVRRCSAR